MTSFEKKSYCEYLADGNSNDDDVAVLYAKETYPFSRGDSPRKGPPAAFEEILHNVNTLQGLCES